MAYAYPEDGALDYQPCRYGRSRLLFRGPKRELAGDYVAVLGGIETYGRYVPAPYPALLERELGRLVVNLGCPNAGPDAWLGDPSVMEVVERAAVTVVQVPAASDLTNRLYGVHPRRNDRFVKASAVLQAVYRGVDFTDFTFTRHMLRALHAAGPERFSIVAEEVQAAWLSRMGLLMERIPGRKVLLWMADHPPRARVEAPVGEPLLVDQAMVEAVAAVTDGLVLAVPSAAARAAGTEGMVYPAMAEPAARGLPGVAVHAEVAGLLAGVLRGMG